MKTTKEERRKITILYIATIAYFLLSAFFYLNKGNYEFIYYIGLMVITISYFYFKHEDFKFTFEIYVGLSIIGFLHALGGILHFNGLRLYDIHFWKFGYDNFVHFIASLIMTLIAYNLIKPNLKEDFLKKPWKLGFFIVVIAIGLGVFVEIGELIAVIFLHAEQAVGDYLNNALDLVFNLLGALAGVIYLFLWHKKH